MVTLRDSLSSVRAASMVSGMAVSSSPVAGETSSSAASAVGSGTSTATVVPTVAVSPSFSVAVAVTDRSKSVDSAGTVRVIP